jgi:hypothetical protein
LNKWSDTRRSSRSRPNQDMVDEVNVDIYRRVVARMYADLNKLV